MPWWSRIDSPIWSPTVKTGFSEVIGSWKIIAISAPRMSRIVAAPAAARSMRVPSRRAKSMRPDVMRPPPCSTRRITDSAVTDLPDPDSPTMATVSPRPTSNDSSRTACTTRSDVANETESPSTARVDDERGAFTGGSVFESEPGASCARGTALSTARRRPATLDDQTFSGSVALRFISKAGTGLPWPKGLRGCDEVSGARPRAPARAGRG